MNWRNSFRAPRTPSIEKAHVVKEIRATFSAAGRVWNNRGR